MPVSSRYGSQTKEVEAFLARVAKLTRDEALRLAATTRGHPKHQGRTEAESIMSSGRFGAAALADADGIILPLLRRLALEPGDTEDTLTAVRMAAVAMAGRDTLDIEAFRTLYTPWCRAMGHWW